MSVAQSPWGAMMGSRQASRGRRVARRLSRIITAIALPLLVATLANTQEVGTVRGVARTEETGVPIPFGPVIGVPQWRQVVQHGHRLLCGYRDGGDDASTAVRRRLFLSDYSRRRGT